MRLSRTILNGIYSASNGVSGLLQHRGSTESQFTEVESDLCYGLSPSMILDVDGDEPGQNTVGQQASPTEANYDFHTPSSQSVGPMDPQEIMREDLLSPSNRPPTIRVDLDVVSDTGPFSRAQASLNSYLRSLATHILIFTQRPYDFLEKKTERHRQLLARQDVTVVFYSPNPLCILLQRKRVAVLLILVAVIFLVTMGISFANQQRPMSGSDFRLTLVELRDLHIEHAETSHVDFAVLTDYRGCLREAAEQTTRAEGKHLYASFPGAREAGGFSLFTDGIRDLDPVRFEVSVLTEEGEWTSVAHHRNWLAHSGTRRPGSRLDLPETGGQAVVVDLRPYAEWPWIVGRVGGDLAVSAGLLVGGVAGLLGRARTVGRPALFLCWALAALAMLTAAAGNWVRGRAEEAQLWTVYAGVMGGGTLAVWLHERELVTVLPLWGSAILVADLIGHALLIGWGLDDAEVSVSHGVLASLMLVGGFLLWVLLASQRRAVGRIIAQDRNLNEEAWRVCCAEEGTTEELARLQRVVGKVALERHGEVQQGHRIVVEDGKGRGVDGKEETSVIQQYVMWARNEWSTVCYDTPYEGVRWRLIRSLDQIYAQAICLNPILRHKVETWAERTGGMFMTKDNAFVRWTEAMQSAAGRARVKLAPIKKEQRAIEKVIRCYREDASRLVDVCRQTLVFATVRELADCMQAMAQDEGVELVRVKNRMSLEEDGAASAGFRNVSVNLRVVSEEAKSLGVDSHVCEVQLVLLVFAGIRQSLDRVERYKLYRDRHRPRVQGDSAVVSWLVQKLRGTAEDEATRMMQCNGLTREQSVELTRITSIARTSSESTEGSFSREASGGTALGTPGIRPLQRLSSSFTVRTESSTSQDSQFSWKFDGNFAGTDRLFRRFSFGRLAQHQQRCLPRLPSTMDEALSADVLAALKDLVYRRNIAERRSKMDFVSAMKAVSVSSVLFLESPVQGGGSKRVIRFLVLVCALGGVVLTSLFAFHHFDIWHQFRVFRFTAVGTRAVPSSQPLNHSISDFGVARFKCPVFERVAETYDDGPSFTVRYHQPVAMTGFWVRTATNESTSADPSRFWVEGSNDGQAWTTVGASHFVEQGYAPMILRASEHSLPTRRGMITVLGPQGIARDLYMLLWQTANFSFVAMLAAVVRSWLGLLDNARLLGCGVMLSFGTFLCVGVIQWEWGFDKLGKESVAMSLLFAIVGCTLFLKEKWLLWAGMLAMVWGVVTRVVWQGVLTGVGFPSDPITLLLMGILGACSLAVAVRVHILTFSRRMVDADKRHYDGLWADVAATEVPELTRLQDLCRRQRSQRNEDPRHYYNSQIVAGTAARYAAKSPKVKRMPVVDLDQIFAQATCLYPMLRHKVETWAEQTGGMFATKDGSFVRWADAMHSEEERARVKLAPIKKEQRAIEKVIRCYREDASRLVDVCRQTLVFATVRELADCMQVMAQDEGVELVRVKNRMSLEEDGAWSAGFRNVSVNLKMAEAEAKSLGVDSHVCEAQLLLLDFAKLQKSEGHKRYVRFRNVRGE